MSNIYGLGVNYIDGLYDGFIDGFMNNVPPKHRTHAAKVLARKEAKKYVKDLLDK